MDYWALFQLASFGVAIVATALEFRRQWRNDREGFIRTSRLIAVFFAYCAIAILISVALVDGPQPTGKALGLTAFVLGWIAFGGLWLVRLSPRDTPFPNWFGARFGILDAALLATVIAGIWTFLQ